MIYRKAKFEDVEAIYELVADYAGQGVMLARSRNTLYETLRDMVVAIDDDGTLAGVGGLHIIWDRLAEVRTMAVSPLKRRQGIGAEIVRTGDDRFALYDHCADRDLIFLQGFFGFLERKEHSLFIVHGKAPPPYRNPDTERGQASARGQGPSDRHRSDPTFPELCGLHRPEADAPRSQA